MANNTKNKKYEDFMKYMEDIEEEISGQCDRSAQRRQKDKDELDDILANIPPSGETNKIRTISEIEHFNIYSED